MISKKHPFSDKVNNCFTSPYLQEVIALFGANEVYAKAAEMLSVVLAMPLSTSNVYRICRDLGQQVEPLLTETDDTVEVAQIPVSKDEVVYVSMDASMIQSDDGYVEVKAGRIWSNSTLVANGTTNGVPRYKAVESQYSAHLGHYRAFLPKFERSISGYAHAQEQMVFITDGATWIHDYVTNSYPQATHILDYYHAVEHLHAFSKEAGLDKKWIDNICKLLKNNGISQVLTRLENLRLSSEAVRKSRQQLVNYYRTNQNRMRYGDYESRGLSIGNGAMEAANRSLVQVRCKRSGQRWTPRGANDILNLRVLLMSKKWHMVRQFLV